MQSTPTTLVTLVIVWAASILAGLAFIISAIRERRSEKKSMLHRAAYEVRFRLRLAAGLALIIWVVSAVVWALTH